MNKRSEQVKHLLTRMQTRYGEQDADVVELRQELSRLEAEDARSAGVLRYANRSPFADRSQYMSETDGARDARPNSPV